MKIEFKKWLLHFHCKIPNIDIAHFTSDVFTQTPSSFSLSGKLFSINKQNYKQRSFKNLKTRKKKLNEHERKK